MTNVVGSMSEWSGVLKDLFRQIDDGSITLEEMKDLVNHNRLPTFTLQDWQELYKDCFGEQYDFSQLKISTQQSGFDWLIVVAKGMTPQKAYDACAKLFPCWKWTDKSLDKVVSLEVRSAAQEPYAIWLRARVEADEELKNLSAQDLEKNKIPGNGLTERLLLELMYFRKTGKHLDIRNVTLCLGSRYSDGGVPGASWAPSTGKFEVHGCSPGGSNPILRSRAAVS